MILRKEKKYCIYKTLLTFLCDYTTMDKNEIEPVFYIMLINFI